MVADFEPRIEYATNLYVENKVVSIEFFEKFS